MSTSQLHVVTIDKKEAERCKTEPASSVDSKSLKYAIDQFEKAFRAPPKYVARAPGRVNIVGEHIDYNGFGVLPMAIEQSIFVACTSTKIGHGIELEIHSTSPGAKACQHVCDFSKISRDMDSSTPFDIRPRAWSHYVLCALYGVLEALSVERWKKLNGQKLQLLVYGDIPQGAGLSSSSALVVSSALAFLTLFDELPHFTKPQIASLCARCERWVGTEGGGMDQAVSLFAEAGTATYIQFHPNLSHKPMPLPESASWVVCHSLEECHKRGDAARLFNKRVIECKLGCRMLAQLLGWTEQHKEGYPETLWELVCKTGAPMGTLEDMVREKLTYVYTKNEILAFIIGNSVALESEQLKNLADEIGVKREAGMEVLSTEDKFHIRDRLLHVFTEVQRVHEFVSYCSGESDKEHTQTTLMRDLGSLMLDSHHSCSKMYDCSSSRVDKLQQICAVGPGVAGARITGAGWGGSVICLIQSKEVEAFCAHVRARYYDKFTEASKNQESEYLFVTKPSRASAIFSV